jgi:hypothetical protein
MPAPDALLELVEVLRALQEEAVRCPMPEIRFQSWADYRRSEELCNPNYPRACELDRPYYG